MTMLKIPALHLSQGIQDVGSHYHLSVLVMTLVQTYQTYLILSTSLLLVLAGVVHVDQGVHPKLLVEASEVEVVVELYLDLDKQGMMVMMKRSSMILLRSTM